MKRFLIVILTLSFVVSSVVFSASAADYDSNFFNVLEYSSCNDSGSNYGEVNPDGTFTYKLPQRASLGYVEILFTANSVPVQVTMGGRPLTCETIGLNFYRAYANLNGYTNDVLEFSFGQTVRTQFTVFGLEVTFGVVTPVSIGAAGRAIAYNVTQDFNVSSSSGYTGSITGSAQNGMSFFCQVVPTNWRYYDYIDCFFYTNANEIQSVTCYIQSGTSSYISVPFEVSYIGDKYTGPGGMFYLQISCDLTSIQRYQDGNLVINISGQSNTGTTTNFVVQPLKALSITNNTSMLHYYFRDLTNNLREWFSELGRKIDDMVSGDTSKSDDFADDFAQQETQMGDLIGDLESVTQPTLGNIDITNDPAVVNPSALTAITDWSRLFFGNSFFLKIFTVMMVLATGSFVLFGKR